MLVDVEKVKERLAIIIVASSIDDEGSLSYCADLIRQTDLSDCAVEMAEIDRLRKDAERYKWLRSEEAATNPKYYPFWKEFSTKLCRENKMDAAVDTAMQEPS